MREMLQSLQRQVVRQERLTAVGLLVSGVAHELNNPLQAILGTMELLERHQDLPPEMRDEICVRQDAERPGPRDHPEPVALQQPAARARDARGHARRHRRSRPAPQGAISTRRSIALDVETSSVRKVNANFTELEQVTAQFRHQRAAGHRGGAAAPGRILISLVGQRPERCVSRCADNGPGVQAGRRAEAVPAVLHDEARRQGHRPRPVRQLRHHRFLRRRDRLHRRTSGAAPRSSSSCGRGQSRRRSSRATNDRPAVLRGPVLPRV